MREERLRDKKENRTQIKLWQESGKKEKMKVKMFPLTGNSRVELSSGNIVTYNGEFSSESETSDDDYKELESLDSALFEEFKRFFVDTIEPSLPKIKEPAEFQIKFSRGRSYLDRSHGDEDEFVHDAGRFELWVVNPYNNRKGVMIGTISTNGISYNSHPFVNFPEKFREHIHISEKVA